VANAPTANAPVARAPVAAVPAADAPVAQAPAASAPVAQAPVANAPAAVDPSATSALGAAPPYGVLKNGKLPTYRAWKRMTQKARHSAEPSSVEVSGSRTSEDAPRPTTPAPQDTCRRRAARVRTAKYRLGKLPGRRVGVLIKNRATRKRVQGERSALRTQRIPEIKNYLRSKNLLKVGSNAPPDVLRQMYEQCVLAGDVENTSGEALIHNYLNRE